ncbi:MAG: hypothetical protein M0Z30_03020 [Actinomycetota bacterium]|nr:hypothetical protein [Actinomycetota bacterium]
MKPEERERRAVGARRGGRCRPLFIAWGAVSGRSEEIAAEVGAEVLKCFPPGPDARPPAPVRYALSTLMTCRALALRRPRAVIVTNPPIIPVLLAALYAEVTRARLVLDDHPGAFGAMGYRPGRWTEFLHRRVAKRAELCLVTERTWVERVEAWGGRALIFHESPGKVVPQAYRPPQTVPKILYVSTFARDEPSVAVMAAAKLVPELQLMVTGDPARRPPGDLPANVELLGFLAEPDYLEALAAADAVLALTTEPTSAMRAAFEAIWAQKVLVVSDWPLTRQLFPDAVHAGNDPAAIAAGLRRAIREHGSIGATSTSARERQLSQWQSQLGALRSVVEGPGLS